MRFNGFSIVALTLVITAGLTILIDLKTPENPLTAVAAPLPIQNTPTNTPFQPLLETATPTSTSVVPTDVSPTPAIYSEPVDLFEEIRLPYDDYVLTQGTHGAKYGDAAIDLTAGKGMAVLSPIYGVVTKNGYDIWGNTALIIENDKWAVKLLHGDYFVAEGDWIQMGQVVGRESNHGYTIDLQGVSCKKRNCGYHTHLNVFDKRKGENANLIELLHP